MEHFRDSEKRGSALGVGYPQPPWLAKTSMTKGGQKAAL
ncbi:hypothetical protein BOS5A_10641 [Bosea sp. EC-HK365B]|nr:hypothetical protein BOSE21B_10433 [Bosea sp. 21B]CAD5266540.1 hypothetical protein BOSE7B_150702 [Bosea sp. 7B]VVT44946.1 hypothetical protein BOS5A_10641 [Bosea sp. EC-HK365B]VXC52082.1 hypothetical protein BOSE127_190329 [Bosea sp. 127]